MLKSKSQKFGAKKAQQFKKLVQNFDSRGKTKTQI